MSHIVKKYSQDNFITNRLGIPPFDNVNLSYDSSDNVSLIVFTRDTGTVAKVQYSYDSAENITNIKRTV